MKAQKFRKLEVWAKSMDFIEVIYRITEKFPLKETYGLTSQLRRATLSIALNIAEGSGANTDCEFSRFLTISLRSTYEAMCAIEIAERLAYFNKEVRDNMLRDCEELSMMITGLKKKLKADS